MSNREHTQELIVWAQSVWNAAGVPADEAQVREMAYVAGRTVVGTMFLPFAEKNGGADLAIRFAESLRTVPGWEPANPDSFLESYDDVVAHFVNVVEPHGNSGSPVTERHREIDQMLDGVRDSDMVGGRCAQLLIDGVLGALRPTWIQDIRGG